jgi:hypothetical protein
MKSRCHKYDNWLLSKLIQKNCIQKYFQMRPIECHKFILSVF